jgi:hypothetical protein
MDSATLQTFLIGGTFVLAGGVKGMTGMGLPTVAIALLGLLMAPVEAAALLVIPSLVTNLWQFLAGHHRSLLLRRMWPMLVTMSVATWASTGLIAGAGAGYATTYLGLALVGYALIGLFHVRLIIDASHEGWLAPLVGTATGIITGATGVLVIPAVPYLQALGLDKDDLVQALGLSFTLSTVALALGLASYGAFLPSTVGASVLCTGPALLGMLAGQAVRARIDPRTFRVVFFGGLLFLGVNLIVRAAV